MSRSKTRLVADFLGKIKADPNTGKVVSSAEEYTDQVISELVGDTPTTLDTLEELSIRKVDKINITGDTVGSASQVPVITFNEQGQITSATETAVAGVSSTSYNSTTGVITINTSDGGSHTADLGVGTADSPTFADVTLGTSTSTVSETFDDKVDKINVTGATVGSASQVPVITYNAQGQITSATTTNVAGVSSFSYDSTTEQLTITTADGGSYSVDVSSLASESFVNGVVANLVDSAPVTLDTLNELAAALGDDPNFATTVSNSIGTKAAKTTTVSAGTALTGGGDLSANRTISHANVTRSNTTDSGTLSHSGTFEAVTSVTTNAQGHVTGAETTTYTLPAGAVPNDATITISAGTDLATGGDFTTDQGTNETITINHANISRTDTTSTASPAHGGTVSVVNSVSTNARGHVTGIDVKTITLPADNNTWRPIHDSPVDGATTTSISSNWAFDNVKTAVPSGAVFTDTVYTHPTYAGDDFSIDTGALSGATVISDIDINVTTDTLGHVTDANASVATRTLTPANIGAMATSHPANNITSTHLYMSNGDGFVWNDTTNVMSVRKDGTDYVNIDAGNISSYANNYTHPSHPGDDINLDTGALSGATVISDLDFNVTTDTLGHVTDANATYATRNITAADVGAAPASHSHSNYLVDSYLSGRSLSDANAADGDGITAYYLSPGAANSPAGTDHSLLTLSHSSSWATQEAADWRTNARYIRKQENGNWSSWQRLFADDYHPNADKWTTARTLSLTGDVTGSVSWDGSGNASLTATVADNSHNHSSITGAYVGLDTSGSASYPRMYSVNNPTSSPDWLRMPSTGGGILPYSNGNSYVGTSSWRFSQGWFNTINGGTPWHSGNDGSGSGLDADTVDGLHASSFASSSHTHSLTLSGDVTGSGTVGGTITTTVANDSHNHSSSSGDFTVGGDLYAAGGQVHVNSGNMDVKYSMWGNNDTTYGIGMTSGVTYGALNDYAMTFCMNNDTDRGFWWGYSGQSKSDGAMSLTTAGSLTVKNSITINGGTAWHSGNDGSGSGLDADKVDGLQASQFLRSDTSDTMNGSLTVNGSITASSDVTAFSDERLKSDIVTIPDALDTVSQLRGVNYIKDDKPSTGVIAQEVERVIPEVVHTADDEMGTKSVAYGNLVGLLIEAVKELKAEIDELKGDK